MKFIYSVHFPVYHFKINPIFFSCSAELKKAKEDYKKCYEHVEEQSEIVRNLQVLQDETQQG